jgi:hypothetical protein
VRCCDVLESVAIWELGLPSSKRVASDAALEFPDMVVMMEVCWGVDRMVSRYGLGGRLFIQASCCDVIHKKGHIPLCIPYLVYVVKIFQAYVIGLDLRCIYVWYPRRLIDVFFFKRRAPYYRLCQYRKAK